jgi:hypothetical protein
MEETHKGALFGNAFANAAKKKELEHPTSGGVR